MPRGRTIVVVMAGALLLASGVPRFVDVDVWHLMALARETLARGHVPREDVFAYTPTVFPVVQHEWGSGVVLYALAMLGGVVALQVARVVLATGVVAGAIAVARSRGATTATLAALAPLAIVMSWIGFTAIRPQVFTLAFLALWLVLLERDRRGSGPSIGGILASQVVWQNLHAGFVVGWGFVTLHVLEQAVRGRWTARYLLFALLVPAVALNPYGLAYYPYLVRALTMDRPLIGEWQPIWHANPVALGVFVASILIATVAVVRAGVTRVPGLAILATAAYLAASHERHVSIFALVWFAFVPSVVATTGLGVTLDRLWARPPTLVTRTIGLVTLAAGAVVFASHRPWQLLVPGTSREGAPSAYPVGPVAYLRDQAFAGNAFVPFVVGAFVSWKLHPRVKVSIDSRYEVAYPPERLVEHVAFYSAAADWQATLARYPTDVVLVRRTDAVAGALATQAVWRPVYQDDAFVLYARPGLDLPTQERRDISLLGSFP
jgi:hypothetical protein